MIRFINHACFSIELEENLILFDPWFEQGVFNDSWSLLWETKLDSLPLEKLTHIFVSHEHPDHLHFPTLKSIIKAKPNIKLIFPNRNDPTVKNVLEKIGYRVHYIMQNSEKYVVNKGLKIKYFSNNPEGDHTIVINYLDKVIVNQNDHYTDSKSQKMINAEFPTVDILFTQYSLAGYYANREDHEGIIKNGHDWHIERLKFYEAIFKPKILVPFASFVYFCKDTNFYLNNYRVKLSLIYEMLKDKCFIPKILGEIKFEIDSKKNIENLKEIENKFDLSDKAIIKSEKIETDILENSVRDGINKLVFKNIIKRMKLKSIYLLLFIAPVYVRINDINKILKIKLFNSNVSFVKQSKKIDFSIPSEELNYMFNYPWGADTANITATVSYFSKRAKVFFNLLLLNYKKG